MTTAEIPEQVDDLARQWLADNFPDPTERGYTYAQMITAFRSGAAAGLGMASKIIGGE